MLCACVVVSVSQCEVVHNFVINRREKREEVRI